MKPPERYLKISDIGSLPLLLVCVILIPWFMKYSNNYNQVLLYNVSIAAESTVCMIQLMTSFRLLIYLTNNQKKLLPLLKDYFYILLKLGNHYF